MNECKERKVNEKEVGCEEEESERKSAIRQAEGTGDERIRRGSTGSKGEVERERHKRWKRRR